MDEASPTDQGIRCFIALELPEEARRWCAGAIERARQLLGADEVGVRWVDPNGIHLTLKFLGSVSAGRIPAIGDATRRLLADQPSFALTIGPAGVFPGPRAPRVLWLGLLGDLPALHACQARVEQAAESLGFPREKRALRPHLTLGRVRDRVAPAQRAAIGRLPAEWPPGNGPTFEATAASLMQSHLGPQGARYTRLADLPFGGTDPLRNSRL